MTTRVYFQWSPTLGTTETKTLVADSLYKMDMGPTLGWQFLLGRDINQAFAARAGPLVFGNLGTQPGQPSGPRSR